MDWLHYNFTANGTSELKAWRVKNFVCCSSHNKRFNYPVFAVYKRHVTVALKIIISLWTGVSRHRERVTPCLDLVSVCSPNLLAVDIFVRLWGAPTEQLFFSPKYHNIFPENKISHPKVLCIIYWLWIKRFDYKAKVKYPNLVCQWVVTKYCIYVEHSALWGQL